MSGQTTGLKILVTTGSVVSVGFGMWHFFVPGIWNWYAYMDETATELVIAVRAINILFSLQLVMLGVAGVLLVFRRMHDKFSLVVILSMSVLLWLARVVLQLVYPQGSQNPVLQYTMLLVFVLVLACYSISLALVCARRQPAGGAAPC